MIAIHHQQIPVKEIRWDRGTGKVGVPGKVDCYGTGTGTPGTTDLVVTKKKSCTFPSTPQLGLIQLIK
jgi:hypothetical protein